MSKCVYHVFLFFCIYVACLVRSESAENTGCRTKPFGKETQVYLENKCHVFINENETFSNTSISRIVLKIITANENSNTISATVTLEEFSSDGKHIEVDNWTIYSNESSNKSHFSENIKMKITFNATGNWSNSTVLLYNEEVEFIKFEKTSVVDEKEISPWKNDDVSERHYRPNSKYIFHIDDSKKLSFNNIMITLNELDIDVAIGEYLLIGAGLDPFERSSLLCTTELQNSTAEGRKYLVDDAVAYIEFVTKATRKNHRGFRITWNYGEGKSIEPPEIDEKEDEKKSAPICIYNITAAIDEVKYKKSEDCFKAFRDSLAEVATNYTNKNSPTSGYKINATNVSIFRISGKFKDAESREALYAMVKITDASKKGKAAFKYHELEEIISIYSEEVSLHDSFEFRKCGPRYVPESWFYFGLILIIPVLCFALLLWIWKQNPISEHYEKKRRLKSASRVEHSKYYVDSCDAVQSSTAENPYTTLPKVQVTNEIGRRTTLNFSETLLSDENASDDEIFNKMYTKRRSDVFELHRMRMTNRLFLNNQGEDNAAFELDEGNNAVRKQTQHEDRAEHTYESVRSSASLTENTRL